MYQAYPEHPLIEGLNDLTIDELREKIFDLNKKIFIVQRTNNDYVYRQCVMALMSYQEAYRKKLKTSPDNNFDSYIDIS